MGNKTEVAIRRLKAEKAQAREVRSYRVLPSVADEFSATCRYLGIKAGKMVEQLMIDFNQTYRKKR